MNLENICAHVLQIIIGLICACVSLDLTCLDHLPPLKESERNPACRETSLLYTQTGRQPDDVICTNSRRSDCGKHEKHTQLSSR